MDPNCIRTQQRQQKTKKSAKNYERDKREEDNTQSKAQTRVGGGERAEGNLV